MINGQDDKSIQLEQGAQVCRRLSLLCRTAFVILVVWSVAAVGLLCYWMIVSDLPSDMFPLAYAVPLVNGLYLANACLIPLIFGNMLGDISEGKSPFTMKNSKRLKALGFILVAYAVLEEVFVLIASQFEIGILDSALQFGSFVRDHIPSTGTTLDLFPLIMGAMFFALSYVFKYGVLLQQESDETL